MVQANLRAWREDPAAALWIERLPTRPGRAVRRPTRRVHPDERRRRHIRRWGESRAVAVPLRACRRLLLRSGSWARRPLQRRRISKRRPFRSIAFTRCSIVSSPKRAITMSPSSIRSQSTNSIVSRLPLGITGSIDRPNARTSGPTRAAPSTTQPERWRERTDWSG